MPDECLGSSRAWQSLGTAPSGRQPPWICPKLCAPGCVVGKQFLLFPVVSSPTLSWRKEGRARMPWPPSPPRPGQEGLTQTPVHRAGSACPQDTVCVHAPCRALQRAQGGRQRLLGLGSHSEDLCNVLFLCHTTQSTRSQTSSLRPLVSRAVPHGLLWEAGGKGARHPPAPPLYFGPKM